MLLTAKDEARFWKKVSKGSANECWEWMAGKAGTGYGAFRLGEQRDGTRPVVPAHIVAFTLHHGYPPKGDLRLRCNNRGCCNPRHLLGPGEVEKHPKRRRTKRKLDAAGRERAVRLKEAGRTQIQIAEMLGVSQSTVSLCVRERGRMTKLSGIYTWTVERGEDGPPLVYVGQSTNIEARRGAYLREWRQGTRGVQTNKPLYEAVSRYGIAAVSHQIVELVDDATELTDREQYWVDHYRARGDVVLLNQRRPARSGTFYKAFHARAN